jgi:hypothetical protein
MSQTIAPPEAPPVMDIHPSDILAHLIVTLLAPMFLLASGGDIMFARMAALETLNAYQARDHADLIAIAQIVGCGLAALGSLSLSMTDDISLSMTLRLRGNAVALNRAAELNRRARLTIRPETATAPTVEKFDAADTQYEADALASVAQTQKLVAETKARLEAAEPPQARTTGLPPLTEEQKHALWAAALSDVAGEVTASLIHLPPAERKIASRRAAALSSCANQLLTGDIPPRPRPGDLTAPPA